MQKQHSIIIGVVALPIVIFVGWLLAKSLDSPEKTNLQVIEEKAQDVVAEKTEEAVTGMMKNGEIPSFALMLLAKKPFDGRDLALGEVLERNDAYTRYYITYKSGDLVISGIMNVPAGTPPEGGFPVLILNHGHIDTSIYTNGRGLKREQDYLARQGFVVLHPDYRNHAESTDTDEDSLKERLGYVEDVVNAVYAVRNSNLEYLDKESIGMMGHSMGGGIAETIMVTLPGLVKGYVLYAPVSMDYRDSYERWMKERPETVEEVRTIYGTPEENPDFWDAISPAKYADRISEPVVIHHGTRDADVPIEWSQETFDLLESKGKDVEYYVYEGEGHEFGPEWTLFMERTARFFKERLGKEGV